MSRVVRMWRRVFAMWLVRVAVDRITPSGDTNVRDHVYRFYLRAMAGDFRADR